MEYRKLLFSCACSVLVFSQNMEALTFRTPAMEALDPVLEVIQDVDVTLPGEASVQRSVDALISSAEDSLSSVGESASSEDDLVLASEESLPVAEEFAFSEKAPLSSIEKVKEHYRDLRVCLESLIQEGTASDKLIRASKIRRDLIDILLLTEAPSLPLFQQAVFQGWSAYFKAYVSWLVEEVSIEAESLGERAQVHLSALKEASKEFKGFLLLLKGLKSDSSSPREENSQIQ
jgi:hypothetical protein